MTIRPSLFATGVSIKNFRGYGTFTLELPAQPCVVLVSGPNGLGKTSLFEAIEWALTGSVKRLDHVSGGKANPRDLARHAEGVESFEVGLAFQDAEGREERVTRAQLIPRTATPPEPVGTTGPEVAKILSSGDPRWNVGGNNLADYLHLTHLHAQVAFLRLVTCDAKDRWMRVSPLAGADRFERVRTNLTNSKAALTRLKERRAQELSAAVTKRRQWADLLARVDQLRKITGTVQDVLSPSDVSKKLAGVRVRLVLSPAESKSPGADIDVGAASDDLRGLRVEVEDARASVARRIEDLGRLRALPQLLADARTQCSAAEKRAKDLDAESAALRSRMQDLSGTAQDRRASYQDALKKRQEAADVHEFAVRAQRDRADLAPLEAELLDAEEQFRAAHQRLEEIEVDLRRRREDLAAYETRLRARDSAREQLAAVDRATAALAEVEALQMRLDAQEVKRDAIAASIQKLDAEIAAASAEGSARDDFVADTAREIEGLRQAFDTLQKALLTIADHVRDEDTECPVCRTHFDHPGELRGIARQVSGGLEPKLVEAEVRLRSASAGRDELRKLQSKRGLDRRKAEADLRAVVDNVAQLKSRVDVLRSDPLLAGRGHDEARLELRRRKEEFTGDIERLERELSGADADQLRSATLDGVTAAEAQKRVRALAQERRNTRLARVQELRARIARLQSERPELGGDPQSLALLVQAMAVAASSAKDAADSASLRVAESQAAESAARQTLVAVDNELAKVLAQVTSLASTVGELENNWREADLPGPISEQILDSELDNLGYRNRDLDEAFLLVTGLAAALDRWRQAEELQAAEDDVRRTCGSREHDDYVRELDEAVEAATLSANVAHRAREASDQLSAMLNRVTADFGGRALRPFDELFRRYLRALVHDERFHSIEATYKPAARSAGLSFKVELGGLDTEAEYILSEGQLGEVSLATMLAASSAFPWSRWRVLLLDDPTQYNDLIHSTALFDVLRNLVRFAKYQIFISTHDNEQASFLRRKLDAICVPWVDCRYVAHSPEGIVAEIRRSYEDGPSALAPERGAEPEGGATHRPLERDS